MIKGGLNMSIFRGLFNRRGFGQPEQPNGRLGHQNGQFGQQSPMQRQMQVRTPYGFGGTAHGMQGNMPQHMMPQVQIPAQALPQQAMQRPNVPQQAPHAPQPYHDPSVRFEPFNAEEGSVQPKNDKAQAGLGAVTADESRGVAFYKSLAKADDATDFEKEKIEELLANKKIESYTLEEPPHIARFQDGLKFALMQEAILIRAIAEKNDTKALAHKMADIALLMSLKK